MKRNIVFLFTLTVLLTTGFMSSRNFSTAAQYDNLQPDLNSGDEGQKSTDQDAAITSAIHLKFANDQVVSSANIHVDTSDRSVRLDGHVSSQAVADRALQLGRSVDGVKTVHSFLVVRSGK
jgi:osmotically-inducible protein OsmY